MHKSFQERVKPWMMECFGRAISSDKIERNHRFLEESLELVQACGATESEAHQLVDYVFDRPVGEKEQEVGGVMVTLAALCLAQKIDMHAAGETELTRIWTKVPEIRAKQAAKPKHSPMPVAIGERVIWTPEIKRPDSDTTVQLFDESASEPVWPGYFDSERDKWFYIDGVEAHPTSWAHMCVGPVK